MGARFCANLWGRFDGLSEVNETAESMLLMFWLKDTSDFGSLLGEKGPVRLHCVLLAITLYLVFLRGDSTTSSIYVTDATYSNLFGFGDKILRGFYFYTG